MKLTKKEENKLLKEIFPNIKKGYTPKIISKYPYYVFLWSWCGLCDCAMIRCPKCQNNCCNAGFGEIDGKKCDTCNLAYQYDHLMDKLQLSPKNIKEVKEMNKEIIKEHAYNLKKTR